MKRKNLIFIVLLIFSATILFCSCNKGNDTPAPTTPVAVKKPNIIVIIVDTLRTDYVGAYGAKHLTPVFDMLATQGALFEKAYAPSSWTVPSMASIFTGMYPQSHGLTNGITVVVKVFKQQQIPEKYVTLAESLKETGYKTFCVTANAHIDEKYGYNRGFDHFKMFKFREGQTIEETIEKWKPMLDEASATTGYFLLMHWVDPHHPYEPREPFISNINPDYLKDAGRVLEDTGPANLSNQGYFKEFPKALDVLKDIYNSEVLWADASVGRVLNILPDVGQSLLIYTSDHGEAFGEHETFLHGYDLYQETIHIPLLMVYPDRTGAGTKIDTPVSLVDIPASILGFAKAKPPKEYEGIDLFDLVSGKTIAQRYIWSHLDKNKEYRWFSVFDGDLKYMEHHPPAKEISSLKTPMSKDSLPFVSYIFDLSKDYGEKNSLTYTRPKDKFRYGKLLGKQMNRPPLVKPKTIKTEVDEEFMDKFKQFGYLGP